MNYNTYYHLGNLIDYNQALNIQVNNFMKDHINSFLDLLEDEFDNQNLGYQIFAIRNIIIISQILKK